MSSTTLPVHGRRFVAAQRSFSRAVLAALVAFSGLSLSSADDYDFQPNVPGSGVLPGADFGSAANWLDHQTNTTGVFPGVNDNAVISGGNTAYYSTTSQADPASFTFNLMQVGDDSSSGTQTGDGTLNQDSGAITTNNWINIGGGSTGTYNLSGTGSFTNHNDTLMVGGNGQGNFNVSGNATVTSDGGGYITIARWGGTSQMTQSGNSVVTTVNNAVRVGEGGNGTYNMNGGTLNAGPGIGLGLSGGASGTFNLNGGLVATSSVYGGPGSSAFIFNGGTLQASGNTANLMATSLQSVTINSGGATFDSNGFNATVAKGFVAGTGNGGLTVIDSSGTGNGVINLTGANSFQGVTTITSGTLEVSGGGSLNSNGNLVNMTGGNFLVTGAGTTVTVGKSGSDSQIGNGGTATLTVSNGALYNAGGSWTQLGNAGGNGTINISSGATFVTDSIRSNGTGTVNFNGGTLAANSSGNNQQILQPNGNTLSVNILAGGATIDSRGDNNIGTSVALNGTAGGALTFTDSVGGGVLSVNVQGNNNGQTNINGGTVLANGSYGTAGIFGTGPIVVNSGGTLVGNGTDVLGYGGGGMASLTVNEGGTYNLAARQSFDVPLNVNGGTVNTQVGGEALTFRSSLNATSATDGTPSRIANPGNNGSSFGLETGSVNFNVTRGGATGSNPDLIVSAPISGGGALVINGNGITQLTTGNSYTGGTTINGGVVMASYDNGQTGTFAGGSTITVNNGGTLQTTVGDALGWAGGSYGTLNVNEGGTVLSSGGRVTLNGTINLSGGTMTGSPGNSGGNDWSNSDFSLSAQLNATSSADGTASKLSGNYFYTGGSTINVTRGGATGSNPDLIISTVLEDNNRGDGALNITGNGITVLTANNTYSAATNINGGTLVVGNGGTTGTLGSGPVVDNSNLAINLSSNYTINNTLSGSGNFIQAGSGTTTLPGAAGYTGNTTVAAGLLNVTGSIVNNGSANVLVQSGGSSFGGAGSTVGGEIDRSVSAGVVMPGTARKFTALVHMPPRPISTSARPMRAPARSTCPGATSLAMSRSVSPAVHSSMALPIPGWSVMY